MKTPHSSVLPAQNDFGSKIKAKWRCSVEDIERNDALDGEIPITLIPFKIESRLNVTHCWFRVWRRTVNPGVKKGSVSITALEQKKVWASLLCEGSLQTKH